MIARSAANAVWPPRLALLAGGLATRLHPLTLDLPKSLIPIAGEPFLAHQLRRLSQNGLREIVICCGHLGDQIEAFAGSGNRFGLSIEYSRDGDQLLGTGGAIRAALPLLGSRFLIMYGDSWLSERIEPVWRAYGECGRPALMTVFRNDNRWGTSNVDYRNGIVTRYHRDGARSGMHYIDYGLQAVEAELIAGWHSAAFDLPDVWPSLADYGLLAGYEARTRFYEIGSLSGLRETEAVIRSSRIFASRARNLPLPARSPLQEAFE
ncbi:MAG TPA: sugar phosphate nucleotidyltransferase [Acidobacteriaceae bacterium]|nr:sugar phosphate nucleotidyltransferase [Acidobacteriaceae bacterium]